MSTALVVGGGPNGLAAAVALAKEGVQVTVLEAADEIGGGARSSEAILPGLLHDHCSAFHPMAVGSTFLNSLGLDRYGLQWRWPEIDCAHPLDSGDAGVLWRSLDDTAAGLGGDGARWRSIFGKPSATFDVLSDDIMGPLLRVPKHPLGLARFGLPTMLPASIFAKVFRTERARALFGGVAAHTFRPLHYPMTSAIGLGIITAGHRHGWPVAAGGSQSITNALASLLGELGGKIETGQRIESASQLPRSDVTIFDLARAPPLASSATGCLRGLLGVSGVFGTVLARSRSTSRSTAACRGPIRRRARPGLSISAATTRKSQPRNAISMLAGCQAGRSSLWASSTWQTRIVPWGTRTRCGRMPMCHRAIRVTPPRRSSCRSSGSLRGSATDRRAGGPLDDPDGGVQPKLCRRGHRHGSQGHPSARVRTTRHSKPVPPRDTGYVYLFGGDPARPRRARNVRRQCRRRRTAAIAPRKLTIEMESFRRAELIFDVRDCGPANGPVVVLLHGFPQRNTVWDAVAPRLSLDSGALDATIRSRDRYGKRNQTRCATPPPTKRTPEPLHESGN